MISALVKTDLHVVAGSAHLRFHGLQPNAYILETAFPKKNTVKIMSNHYLIQIQFDCVVCPQRVHKVIVSGLQVMMAALFLSEHI